MDYEDIWLAIAEGYLGGVRRLGFRHQVNVQPWRTSRRELQDLDDLLRALAREDGENARIKEEEAGQLRGPPHVTRYELALDEISCSTSQSITGLYILV
ncbi:MAG: hypothetical protein Q9169_004736 [Polycauliona sp. 2 TL-2023]